MKVEELPVSLKIEDSQFITCLSNIINEVGSFWKRPLHMHYTKHGVDHSVRIIRILGALMEDWSGYLNEKERFIIVASAYLHDIGMQFPTYAGLEKKLQYSLAELEIVRSCHHETSAELIKSSVLPKSELSLGLNLCSEYVEYIATVSRYHRKLNLNELKDISIAGEHIRVPLLAALMRLGDALDMDNRRIDMNILKTIDIPLESKLHWYTHYYVDNVSCSRTTIEIQFRFPHKLKNSELANVIIDRVRDTIRNDFYDVYDILDSYDLRLYRDVKVDPNIQYDATIECMPDALVEYICVYIVDTKKRIEKLNQTPGAVWFIDGIPYSDNLEVKKCIAKLTEWAESGNYAKAVEEIDHCQVLTFTPRERMIFLCIAGNCFALKCDFFEAEKSYSDVLKLCERSDLQAIYKEEVGQTKVTAMCNTGYIQLIRGEHEKALNNINNALKISEQNNEKLAQAIILSNLGFMDCETGNINEALEFTNKALQLYREIKYRRGEANALRNLSYILYVAGNLDEALRNVKLAQQIHEDINWTIGIADDLASSAIIHIAFGNLNEALEKAEIALTLHRKIGNRLAEANDLGNIAVIFKQMGRLEEALAYHIDALDISRDIGYPRGEAIQLNGIGNIFAKKGKIKETINYHRQGYEISKRIHYMQGMAANLGNLGGILVDNDCLDDALKACEESLSVYREIGDKVGEAQQLRNIGVAYGKRGLYSKSTDYLNRALAIDISLNNESGMASDFENIGHTYFITNKYDNALVNFKKAVGIYLKVDRQTSLQSLYKIAFIYAAENSYKKCFETLINAINISDNEHIGQSLFTYTQILKSLLHNKNWQNAKKAPLDSDSASAYGEEIQAFFEAINEGIMFLETSDASHKNNFIQIEKNINSPYKEALIDVFFEFGL